MFRASRSQGEACVRGVFRPTREDGGLDRGHGVGRARLVGRQAGQILGGAIRCAGVVGCSIRWQRRCGHTDPRGRCLPACRVRSADRRPPVHRAGGGLGLESSRVVAAIACFVLWDGDMVHVGRGVAKAFG